MPASPAARPPCRLYLITPPQLDEAFPERLARALGAGSVAAVQLRLKAADGAGAAADDVLAAGERLMPIVQAAGAAFIVNDRPDLALRLDADGAHVGQEDAPVAEARRMLGPGKIVGATCHASRHLAMEAGEAGADYVAFGAFYPTDTKRAPIRAEPDVLAWWQAMMEIPCVAIGGVTPLNAAPLVRAGADFLAVSQGVWGWPDGPAAAVAQFEALFAELAAEPLPTAAETR